MISITFLDTLAYAFIPLIDVIIRNMRIQKGKCMNRGKIVSGLVALIIYISIIFMILFFYNIHKAKAKNYVEKNSDRVTVTLVNSDKTVFNRRDKVSTPKKPLPKAIPPVKKPILKKHTPKKNVPKKVKHAPKPIPKPKKIVPQPPKKVVPKKVVPKPPKKTIPKKVVPKKPKKVVPKPPKKKVPKEVVPKKPKSAKDLFSSIKTTRPVKKAPKHRQPVKKEPKAQKHPSSIKHNSSITDRLLATHQSGRVSNANRDKGIENAYIAKVKQRMNNWDAVGMKGQWVTVHLTIYNSGKFRYTTSGVSGSMRASLKRYLDTLNRMGLGRHKKSTPYSIQVRFRVN